MTEGEAKTKTCPFTFATPAVYSPNGDGIRQYGPWNCIGSACMAWRWKYGFSEPNKENDKGYCGLAGKP